MASLGPNELKNNTDIMCDMQMRIYVSLKKFNSLTHCDIVMPYGNIDLDQHWLR